MNIAVCIKQTPDTTTRVAIAADGVSVNEDGIQWVINPYDEAALEAALQLTEQQGGEVTVFTLGPPSVEKSLREALAMGAHNAVRVHADRVPADSYVTAKALAEVLRGKSFDLIVMGRQAVDGDQAQVPSRVAQALGRPCVTAIDELSIANGQGTALREVEGGHERVRFGLPAVLGVNRRLNQPRYPSFKGIMMAKKKTIEVVAVALVPEKVSVVRLALPPQKAAGKVFPNGKAAVGDVVRLLHEEAKVL